MPLCFFRLFSLFFTKSLKTESHPSRRPPGELTSRPEKQQPLERPKSSFWSGLAGVAEEAAAGAAEGAVAREAEAEAKPLERPK